MTTDVRQGILTKEEYLAEARLMYTPVILALQNREAHSIDFSNVKIEPFWRVVRFKQQYWIQRRKRSLPNPDQNHQKTGQDRRLPAGAGFSGEMYDRCLSG